MPNYSIKRVVANSREKIEVTFQLAAWLITSHKLHTSTEHATVCKRFLDFSVKSDRARLKQWAHAKPPRRKGKKTKVYKEVSLLPYLPLFPFASWRFCVRFLISPYPKKAALLDI
jgi:hypothetical protein